MRKLVPYPLRVELLRLRRLPEWFLEGQTIARDRVRAEDRPQYEVELACNSSPLERVPGAVSARLQHGKETNVALAARAINSILVMPNQVFSYHHLVGRPSRLRGFLPGLELHEGSTSAGVGGGCCQVSNMLYLLALRAGMRIVERHRHGIDLFPDHARTVPFGCGATVFYNYADLRFENPLPQPVLLDMQIREGQLVGMICAREDPGWRVEVYETDHRFFREDDHWMRENRIRRRFILPDGTFLADMEAAHNLGRVQYEPTGEQRCSEPL